jgi:hypothetical protein
MSLSLGIAFFCFGVLAVSGSFSKSVLFERVSGSVQPLPRTVRVLEIGYRLLGLGAIFGLAIPIYWLSVLRVIGKSTMSSQAFYAPFAVLILGVIPIEVMRLIQGKRPNEP